MTYITRDEFEAREAQRSKELATINGRLATLEANALATHELMLFFREDLPRRLDEQTAKIERLLVDVTRFRRYEQVAFYGFRLAISLPLLKWARRAVAWAITLAGGIGLGVSLTSVLLSFWR